MRRRDLLRLTIGSGTTALMSCVATPRAQMPATVVPPTETLAPWPTIAPTATATSQATIIQATTTPSVIPTRPHSTPTPTSIVEPSPALDAAIEAEIQGAIQANAVPGGVACIRYDGKQILIAAYGLSRKFDAPGILAASPIPAATDTLYDLASITKLFTATAAMRLVEQGKLTLDEPVAHWLPDFAAGGKQDVTLRQLLTHTSGLPADLELWNLESTADARIERVLVTPVLNPPGKVFRYSDLGLIATGHLLEQIVGASLDRIIRDLVTDPLRLDRLMFRPPAELQRRIAATEFETDPDRGLVWGDVHDESAWSLGGVAGHAGLFGSAEQLGRFGQLFLDDGLLDGVRLLHTDTIAEMTRNQIVGPDWRGLGWELNAGYYMGHLANPRAYGHTGFTGTSLVIDALRRLVVVLLTNRVHPTRDGPSINPTRQAVANAAMAAAAAA
jgi:CubicO group peptidase (beta-lactamase class C family)